MSWLSSAYPTLLSILFNLWLPKPLKLHQLYLALLIQYYFTMLSPSFPVKWRCQAKVVKCNTGFNSSHNYQTVSNLRTYHVTYISILRLKMWERLLISKMSTVTWLSQNKNTEEMLQTYGERITVLLLWHLYWGIDRGCTQSQERV